MLRPESCGYLELGSSDYLENVRIHANYYSDPQNLDILTALRAVRYQFELMLTTQAMHNAEARFIPPNLPECDQYSVDSDDYLIYYVKHMTTTIYHQVGTARMGPPEFRIKSSWYSRTQGYRC